MLLLGCLITLVVAWGSAAVVDLWSDIWIQRHGTSASAYPCWGVVIIEKPGATYVFRTAISKPHSHKVAWYRPTEIPYWSRATSAPHDVPLDTFAGFAEDGRGWPFICLTSSIEAALVDTRSNWRYGEVSWGIPLGSMQSTAMPRALPLRLVVPGFLLNVLLYSGAFWCVLRGPRLARRWYREAHDRCGRCGYPTALSPRCTECGSLLPRRRRATSPHREGAPARQ